MPATTTTNPNASFQTGTDQNAINAAYSPISVSTANSQQTPLNIATPGTPSLYNVASLPALAPTQPEQDAQNTTNDLEQLNEQIAGKAAFTTKQYQDLGYAVSTDANGNITANDPALQDLNTQLTTLQNNAQAIPLQEQNNAQGRGVTAGGLAPLQSADLRNNAIQALTISSLMSARQGKLATAQMMVNNAVTQKYGPIEAEIAAKQQNLQLIENSPAYSLADKNRAQAQQQALSIQQAQLDAAKTNYVNTQNEVLKYAPIATPQALQALQMAQSPAQVAQIASMFGLSEPQTGRYKDSITSTTDAFGNQVQHVRVLDTLTGQFVNAPAGVTAATLNSNPSAAATAAPAGGTSNSNTLGNGLSFDQYGLLAKTDFNPNAGGQTGTVDQLAFNYLDTYLKNGTVPTASTLGRNMKPAGFAAVEARARDLYYQATGSALPNPQVIKGYQQQLVGNNKLLNNLAVQEGTIEQNSALLLQNLNGSNINQAAPVINGIIDGIRNSLGDPDVAQFLAQNTTVGNELGSLLALKNAQGTTVHDKLEAAGIISANDNANQIAAKVKILMQEALNSRSAINAANTDLYRQIDPLMQDQNNPLRTQQQNVQANSYPTQITYNGQLYNVDPQTGDLSPAQ
jgi:hypothetical protein